MKVLVTGICGFVGGGLAAWLRREKGFRVFGVDNFSRPGSETNRLRLRALGVDVRHGDVRSPSDLESLPDADWVIDAAANPSVLAGVRGPSSSRQLLEHNLLGTLNVLEYCKRRGSGLVLLSTSRVYSVPALAALPVKARGRAFVLKAAGAGFSARGLTTAFPTGAPVSLYGATKLASEVLALEYGAAFSFPVWVDRCGVMAGAGQFGTAEQGIFSYWLQAYARRKALRYIGFGGRGLQVRDALHPEDLGALLCRQMARRGRASRRVFNVGGGPANAMSLAQLSDWCAGRFGPWTVSADRRPRPFDVPWLVMDNAEVSAEFSWKPRRGLASILDEIAGHAERHPDWLELVA